VFLQKEFCEVLTPPEFFDNNPMKPQISLTFIYDRFAGAGSLECLLRQRF
jgi:hypothetical protein